MTTDQSLHPEQPLDTFHGLTSQIELYPNHVRVMRTDALTQVIPSLYNETKEISLSDIDGVYIYESRYVRTKWITFAIHLSNHKYVSFLFDRKDYGTASQLKRTIQNMLPQPVSV
jgi:hypothetical protein